MEKTSTAHEKINGIGQCKDDKENWNMGQCNYEENKTWNNRMVIDETNKTKRRQTLKDRMPF